MRKTVVGTVRALDCHKIFSQVHSFTGLPWRLSGKESTCQCRTHRFDPWGRKIPCRREWPPTPAFLPRKSHGEGSLVDDTVHGVAKESAWRPDNNNNKSFTNTKNDEHLEYASLRDTQNKAWVNNYCWCWCLVAKLCPTLLWPHGLWSLSGSSVHGISSQARTPEWASLVVQWLRIHLPMQGTLVRSLVLEDTRCLGAAKSVHHNLLSLCA